MLTYEIYAILCDDIHYIDSHPKTLNLDTTKSASMLLEIEKHLKMQMLHNQSKGLLILILFHNQKKLKN